MSVRAVAFDFGGVIEIGTGRNFIDRTAQILGVPVEAFKATYFRFNHLSNVGNLPWEEMFMKVVAEFDTRAETVEKVKAAIQEMQLQNKINTELVSLFPILRKQGLKVGILSNATSNLRDKLRQHEILGTVDEVVISGEIGFQKPHKEAFDVLFNRLHVQPNEVVFIDDSTKSLENAGEIGYIPLLFTNNEQLRTDLQGLGVAVA